MTGIIEGVFFLSAATNNVGVDLVNCLTILGKLPYNEVELDHQDMCPSH